MTPIQCNIAPAERPGLPADGVRPAIKGLIAALQCELREGGR